VEGRVPASPIRFRGVGAVMFKLGEEVLKILVDTQAKETEK